jgi:DNA-3-methyladenine glycosylase
LIASNASTLKSFFERDVTLVARELIGASVFLNGVGGIIVETEAYHSSDAASHSHRGQTERTRAMFGPAAHSYVYLSYGMHWCLNFVSLPGSGVLIRALEPTAGIEFMMERRGAQSLTALCSGPGKLCQALGITNEHYGLPLDQPPFAVTLAEREASVSSSRRIGISKAVEKEWRFSLTGSPFLSRKG